MFFGQKLVNEPLSWYYNIAPSIIYGSATVKFMQATEPRPVEMTPCRY